MVAVNEESIKYWNRPESQEDLGARVVLALLSSSVKLGRSPSEWKVRLTQTSGGMSLLGAGECGPVSGALAYCM